jgi:DMSO/TMAO reductase YedYZ heme-binding membrane subunit
LRRRLADGDGVILAAGNGTALWYLTRASGVVSLLLLTAGLVLGILGTVRWRSDRWPRFAVVSVHRNLTLFAIAFVALHVITTVADGYAPVGLKDAVIPFVSKYRPLWLGFGALAFDLLLALVVTSLLRAKIGYRAWRAVHWLAYASWPLALVHGLGNGSDARFGWLVIVTILCAAAVGAAFAFRLLRSPGPVPLRAGAGAAAVVLVVLAVGWYRGGPGKRGWAARAGTPAYILRRHASTSVRQATVNAPTTLPKSFDGQLSGRFAHSNDNVGDVGVAFGAAVNGRVPAVLRLTLWGTAAGEEGVTMSNSSVTFAPVNSGAFSGKITALEGNQLAADLTNSSGVRLRLTIVLNLDQATNTFTGSVHGNGSESE